MGRSVHRCLVESEFKNRYLAVKQQLPRIKHQIHGGIEYFYAGMVPEQLRMAGVEERLNPDGIDRTLTNLEIGLSTLVKEDFCSEKLYVDCQSRSARSEKLREAAWQFTVHWNCKPMAVVGMNFHDEDGNVVSTVSNIQGRDSSAIIGYNQESEQCWPVEALELILDNLPGNMKVRGITGRKHPFVGTEGLTNNQASCLYDLTFKKVGMVPVRDAKGKVEFYEVSL